MQTHVKAVAVIHIVYGVLGIFAGLAALLFFGGIAGIVAMNEPSSESAVAIPILGIIGGFGFLMALAVSVPCLIAGIGLLRFRQWARILTTIISVINVFNVPIGTVISIYAFWALFSKEGAALFEQPANQPVRTH